MIKMKPYFLLVLMCCFLIMIFLTTDAVDKELFASLTIVIGSLTLASFSDDEENEHYTGVRRYKHRIIHFVYKHSDYHDNN